MAAARPQRPPSRPLRARRPRGHGSRCPRATAGPHGRAGALRSPEALQCPSWLGPPSRPPSDGPPSAHSRGLSSRPKTSRSVRKSQLRHTFPSMPCSFLADSERGPGPPCRSVAACPYFSSRGARSQQSGTHFLLEMSADVTGSPVTKSFPSGLHLKLEANFRPMGRKTVLIQRQLTPPLLVLNPNTLTPAPNADIWMLSLLHLNIRFFPITSLGGERTVFSA